MNHNRVIAFHFIFCAYGFWLPNDPRGSWSTTVRALHLQKYGDATKVDTTRSLAHKKLDKHDHRKRIAAKRDLRYPPVRFNGLQARAIARGFAEALTEQDYIIQALAILPDHVHLIMAWHARPIDEIARHLKAKATRQMSKENRHPLAAHADAKGRSSSPWARNFWCPFIRDARHHRVAIRYVEANPVKAGLRQQQWQLVDTSGKVATA